MKTRALLVMASAALLASSCFGGFTARLWFRNATTGAQGAGAVLVSPGDWVEVNFSFHQTDGTRPSQWTLFQATIDLSGQSILSDESANTWGDSAGKAFGRSSKYPTKVLWQPSDGAIYDQAVDPSSWRHSSLVTRKGVYALIGVSGAQRESRDIDVVVFRFQVSRSAVRGSELRWANERREMEAGVTTRLMDDMNRSHQITDNWLRVR